MERIARQMPIQPNICWKPLVQERHRELDRGTGMTSGLSLRNGKSLRGILQISSSTRQANLKSIQRYLLLVSLLNSHGMTTVEPMGDATPFLYQLRIVTRRALVALWRSPDYIFTRLCEIHSKQRRRSYS